MVKLLETIITIITILPQVVYSTIAIKRSDCYFNSDCEDTLICSSGRCIQISTESQVIAKQTCPNFKNPCLLDSECACAEKSMVCMENECVYSSNQNKPNPHFCEHHSDCAIPNICEQGVCREARTLEEMNLLTIAYQICYADSQCPPGYRCMSSNHRCVEDATVSTNSKFAKREDICTSNRECDNGYSCKNRVCVKNILPKVQLLYKNLKICKKHSDCEIPKVCDQSRCREARKLSEIHMLMATYKECSLNSQCPPNYICSPSDKKCIEIKRDHTSQKGIKEEKRCKSNRDCGNGFSCKKFVCVRNLPAVHLAYCLINAFQSICFDDGDCPICQRIRFKCQHQKCISV